MHQLCCWLSRWYDLSLLCFSVYSRVLKKSSQELYGLICYAELRKKVGGCKYRVVFAVLFLLFATSGMQLNAACLLSGGKAALEGNGVKTSPFFYCLSQWWMTRMWQSSMNWFSKGECECALITCFLTLMLVIRNYTNSPYCCFKVRF